MIQRIVVSLVLLVVIVIGIGIYLSPDDLADCEQVDISGSCRAADAVVVISGGDTDARTDEAIRLYRGNWAPLIIVSGAAADKTGPSNAQAMRERALSRGVPAEAIIEESDSETTRQNAAEVRSIIESNEIKDIILVTSAYHMRRASLEFSAGLPDGVVVRSHPVSSDKQWGPAWWATPWGWLIAGTEIVKILLFSIGVSR